MNAPKIRRTQIGLGKFLVQLLGDLSRKDSDPHEKYRDTPYWIQAKMTALSTSHPGCK